MQVCEFIASQENDSQDWPEKQAASSQPDQALTCRSAATVYTDNHEEQEKQKCYPPTLTINVQLYIVLHDITWHNLRRERRNIVSLKILWWIDEFLVQWKMWMSQYLCLRLKSAISHRSDGRNLCGGADRMCPVQVQAVYPNVACHRQVISFQDVILM